MQDDASSKTMMSDCLKDVIESNLEQFDAVKELITAFFALSNENVEKEFVGSLVGVEVSNPMPDVTQFKVDVKLSKDEAFDFVTTYAMGARSLDLIISHKELAFRADNASINVVRLIDIDHTTGLSILAIDVFA